MSEEKKEVFGMLWSLKNLNVAEFFEAVKNNPDLKFLLGSVGIWYVGKKIFKFIVFLNIAYFIYHMLVLVSG